MEIIFHHEFSSVLMFNYKFPSEQWLAANPSGFRYLNDHRKELRSVVEDTDPKGSDQLYQQGILRKYATSSMENDVNAYAAMAFTDPDRMRMLINNYLIIQSKYLVLKQFYLSLSPEFAKHFDKIR